MYSGKIRYGYRTLIVFVVLSVICVVFTRGRAEDIPSGNTNSFTTESGGNIYLPIIPNNLWEQESSAWPMLGANIERTSWTSEQVDGNLKPLWYKQFEPYIDPKIQIIAAYNTLYISTSAGLYALDASSGAQKWVYPTEMPLGHSPAVVNGVAYVGGFDSRLHAIDALTGEGLWTFTASGGFSTSPLVVSNIVYIGCRDGYFYAIQADGPETGELLWKFRTGGPIEFTAAYKDGVVFFASNDSYAYAVNAQTGDQVWSSEKLPGAGFHTWWPVVYKDWVVFAGSHNYRVNLGPGLGTLFTTQELDDINPNHMLDDRYTLVGPLGTEPGDWADGTPTIDTSKPTITEHGTTTPVTEYFESNPWRRTYFVLNRATGDEYTSDFDQDLKPEFAPMLWFGTHSGNRYPPVVGSDQILYQGDLVYPTGYIAGGATIGWQPGTPFISFPSISWHAVDEPMAYSAGGNRIYWNKCCDRTAGSMDITLPASGMNITYFSYNLEELIPGYSSRYYPDAELWSTFGGINGVYGPHGNQNPPIPYHGKLFMHRSNAVIAFGPPPDSPVSLPVATIVDVNDPTIPYPSIEQVKQSLAEEIHKIIAAGHLRPGYQSSGIFYAAIKWQGCSDAPADYWHNPADTFYILARALPFLPEAEQSSLKIYLQEEFLAYPPYQYSNTGWAYGTARELYTLPPEVEADRVNFPPTLGSSDYEGWFYPPQGFYAMWKYAQVFPAQAKAIFDTSKNLLETPPDNAYLIEYPQVLNAYIAGYKGYLELQTMAGYEPSSDIENQYNQLLSLRVSNFSMDGPAQPVGSMYYCRGMNVSRNFLFLVPELGQYLHDHISTLVQEALNEYTRVAPYWFVSNFDAIYGEGATAHLYDYHSIFQAKALILQESYQELAQYLDIPATDVGDLYYIDNLIAVIEAENR